jgi:HK97 family phage portal protein
MRSRTTRLARATRADVTRKRRTVAGVNYGGRARLDPAHEWTFLTGGTYPDGPAPAGERAALSLPPFGRGVALLANAVAGTEWRAMRWDADLGVAVRVADQPAVLVDPDPSTTPWHYRWAAIEDLILYGNHFALYGDLDFRTLRPGWLVPLPADDVWIIVDPENGDYAFTVGGELLTADSLLHVSAGSRSGEVLGRGVLAQYGDSLGGYLAAETHAGNYFAGAALPPAVLQSPTVLTQAQAGELKAKWRAMTSDREPVVLPSGYVLTPIVSNAESAQLVESRTWNAQAVAMMLGIPSYKLGLPGATMTYQNIESADIEFVRDSVDRYGRPLSEAFSKWLMPRSTSVAWDYAGRMRADAQATANVVGSLVGSGVLTVDEARAMIGRGPLALSTGDNSTPEGVPRLTPSEVPQ